MFKSSEDPYKPALSRSALPCERKGDRVSIIAHEEIPTGMEKIISLCFFLPNANAPLFGGRTDGKPSYARFGAPGSRAGWEDSCSQKSPLSRRDAVWGILGNVKGAVVGRRHGAESQPTGHTHGTSRTPRTGPPAASRPTCDAFSRSLGYFAWL